jgi:hypothetical protein
MRRQRPQHEDPADLGVGVELGDLADDLAKRRVAGQQLRTRVDAELLGVAVDPSLVDLRGEVLADQQGRDPGAVGQAREFAKQRGTQLFGVLATVDQHAREAR